MAKNENPFSYRKIRVNPKDEVLMVGVLIESGKKILSNFKNRLSNIK